MAESHSTQVEYRTLAQYPEYRFGNDGSVWSCRLYHYSREWRKLRPGRSDTGCLVVVLCVDGKKFTRKVHRLILEAFVGPRPEGMECCHNNGNSADNRLENLRWDTSASNTNDTRKHGTMCRGEKSPEAIIGEDQVKEIRRRYAEGGTLQRELADEFGLTRKHISDILRGKRWAHVPMTDEERARISEVSRIHDDENRQEQFGEGHAWHQR